MLQAGRAGLALFQRPHPSRPPVPGPHHAAQPGLHQREATRAGRASTHGGGFGALARPARWSTPTPSASCWTICRRSGPATTQALRQRREEGARALLHAEQRNLLAQKLAADFAQQLEGLEVADFVGDFLRNSWAQVVAEAQLSCADGSDDPYGYRALVDDMIWSVQKSTATRGRARRLVQMIPGLLAKLREGLDRIDTRRN